MKTPSRIVAFLFICLACITARAESWPTLEQVANTSLLIVHCRAEKSPDGAPRFAVVEVWKGAYAKEAFVKQAPQGFILADDKVAPIEGEVVLVYSARNQAVGKFGRYDMALPVTDGKLTYPGATSDGPKKEYALAEFRAAIQAAVKDPLVNGGFDDSPAGSPPAGWKEAYPNGAGVVTVEGKDTFLRLASANGANTGMSQQVAVSSKAASVMVMGRMRGKPRNEKEEKRAAAQVALQYLDAKGAMINAAIVASENSPNWRTFRREFKLPPGCVKVEVVARSVFAAGTFDFDEVRVEFK